MTEMVSRPYARTFVDWARDRDAVLCLSADLTSSCEIDNFRAAYPERFISCGMAEQNMMGVAAGLAREGFTPFVHTFGVFVTRRPYDQVAMSIGYPNLPVRLMGFLPGLTTPGGVTHQAIDDVALMRVIPNMTIIDTGDATEVETVLDALETVEGPVYSRILRKDVPRLFDTPLTIGRARILDADGRGVCVISAGICTEEAMRAVSALREVGVEISHLHVSTLKPFDDPTVREVIADCAGGVVTMENHSIIGGLGSAVAETIGECGLPRRLIRIGLRDRYAHGGSLPYLLERYGITARHLVAAVEDLLGERLNVDLDEGRKAAAPGEGAEDL